MKKLILIAAAILAFVKVQAQDEKTTVGTICYVQDDPDIGTSHQLVDLYTYHGRLEIKLGEYQITVKEEALDELKSLVASFDDYHSKSKANDDKSPQLIGSFSPEAVSWTTKVVDPKASVEVFYCLSLKETGSDSGNLIFKIPELTDMFGGATAEGAYFYFDIGCTLRLDKTLKS